MKETICAVIAAGALATVTMADTLRDGNWWVKQSHATKVAYILGALDHAAGHAALADRFNVRAQTTLSSGQVEQVCRRLDMLYGTTKQPTNRTLQVQSALPLVLIWIAGGPGATLESAMQKMREESASR